MEEAVIFFLAVCSGVRATESAGRGTYVVSVGEVPAVRETKTHKAILGLDQGSQGGEAEDGLSGYSAKRGIDILCGLITERSVSGRTREKRACSRFRSRAGRLRPTFQSRDQRHGGHACDRGPRARRCTRFHRSIGRQEDPLNTCW